MKLGKASIIAAFVLSLLTLGSILLLYAGGFRFFTVATPSMAETAPVGTLIVTQPQTNYHEQDIISFYRGGDVYTHRLIRVNADHTYTTKGDLNASEDSYPVKHQDVVGKAVIIAPIWGWLWRALPMLLIGWIIVYLISCIRKLRERWRWPIRIIGGTLVLVIVTFIVNPWLRVNMLSIANHKSGDVQLHIVNTGIFPIRDDDGKRIYSGQTATVRATLTDAQGRYVYVPRPSIGATGVLFAMLWCLLPLFIALLVKLPPPEEEMTGLQLQRERRRNMALLTLVTLFEIILLLIPLSTLAAFTAEVKNSKNTISTRTYFKCANAVLHNTNRSPVPYFAWGMNRHAAPLTDLSTRDNKRPGIVVATDTYPNSGFSSDLGCIRDFDPSSPTPKSNRVATFNGTSDCLTRGKKDEAITAPNTFSLEAWFNTTKKDSGRLIGFTTVYDGNYNASGASDRHIYIDPEGRLVFGAYFKNSVHLLTTPAGTNYADGKWHHVIVSVSEQNGGNLYVDGKKIGDGNPNLKGGENIRAGYWKVGCGKLRGWKYASGQTFDGPKYYTGKLQFVSVYETALTDTQAREHYLAGAP